MSQEISEQENLVYKVIQDYLKKRRPIVVNQLVPYIVSRLSKQSVDINSRKVKSIVELFIQKKIIIEGSRLTRDDILKNKTRKEINEFINKNSAVYFHQIMKYLDLPTHSVIWHLNLLFLFGFIKKTKIEKHYNHYIYYKTEINSLQAKKIYFTKNNKCKDIIEYLRNKNGGCSKTELSKQLGMHPNTIRKYIGALEAIKVVFKKNISNKSLYYLN